MKKVGLICILIMMQVFGSYAADDAVKRGMQLYKKNHYEDAANLLYSHLSSAGSHEQGQTYLSLGLIYFANAQLYRELYATSTAVQIDYLTKLYASDSKSESRFAKFYLGRALMEAGELVEAAAFFKKFIGEAKYPPPYKALAKINMGTIFSLQGAPDKAQNLWDNLNASESRVLTALAAAYSRAGLQEKNPSEPWLFLRLQCRQHPSGHEWLADAAGGSLCHAPE